MSWDLVEAGSRVEAVASIPVKSDMGGAPIGGPSFTIEPGDLGEVTLKRKAGKLQWMVIKWDRLEGRWISPLTMLATKIKLKPPRTL